MKKRRTAARYFSDDAVHSGKITDNQRPYRMHLPTRFHFRRLPLLLLTGLLLLVSCSSDESSMLKIGDQAPGFSLPDLKGRTVRLADYAGSPVVLRFFLIDCKYCRADTPILNTYFRRSGKNGEPPANRHNRPVALSDLSGPAG